MGWLLLRFVLLLLFVYAMICLVAYWWQDRLLFHPTVLPKDFAFPFERTPYEELYIEVAPGIELHTLHFKVKDPKGLVFYVHGNAGSLNDWGSLAEFYQRQQYDLLMFDYRGFGKSGGAVVNEAQFFADAEILYNFALGYYPEEQIVIEGFSIGTATASKLASEHNPRHLVLKAPYYTLGSLVKSKFSFLPTGLLKYPFRTVDYLHQVDCPITLFHGTADELIPYANGVRLAEEVAAAELVTVPNCLHNEIPYSREYQSRMSAILAD